MARERAIPERVSQATLALTIGLPAVREIIRRTGTPVATSEGRLLVALNRAYEAAAVFGMVFAAPTQAQTFGRLSRIRDTARKLSTLLGTANGDDIRDTQSRLFHVLCDEARDAGAVLAGVAGVERIRRWADSLTRVRPAKAKRVSVKVMFAVEMLPDVYEKHFKRPFRLTTNKIRGKVVYGGPALRFAMAVLNAVDAPMTPAALAKAWHRHLVAAGRRRQ